MAKLTANTQTVLAYGAKDKYRSSAGHRPHFPDTYKPVASNQAERLRDIWTIRHSNWKENWLPDFNSMSSRRKASGLVSQDSAKYFRRPIVPLLESQSRNIEFPSRFENAALSDVVKKAQRCCYDYSVKPERFRTVQTQTDYRDGEAQTIPWEPPYTVRPGENPEVLTIAHFEWGKELPPGVHELEIINRLRMRRAWEAILPPVDTPANIKLRTAIIFALEIDEWAYREAEIQAIMDYRLELMREMTKAREIKRDKKIQGRFNRLRDRLAKRREHKIDTIRHNLRRDLRKLQKKRAREAQPTKRDIIEDHANPASELYAPKMRYGEHPGRRHEIIRKELLKDMSYDEHVDTTPSWLPTREELEAIKPKPKPADLCIRETRWTDEKLKMLHEDLKAIRLKVLPSESLSLMQKKFKPPEMESAPYKSNTRNSRNDNMNEAAILIQKLVRGRATQGMMYEGRDRCRELIKELQAAYALDDGEKLAQQEEKARIIELQRFMNNRSIQEDHVCEILDSLEGMTISASLDFLSKELVRLEEERRMHAFALLAERERAKREAEEAGRRQLEVNRRREFDEMFRQVVKVSQDCVETYLEDIIKEGVEWASDDAANEYILDLCDRVDEASKYAADNAMELSHEEMIANMVHNFLLPEVEKHKVRETIRKKQQSYMQQAHQIIYEEFAGLPEVPSSVGDSIENEGEGSDSPEGQGVASPIRHLTLPTDGKDIVENILESVVSEVFEQGLHITAE